ncbi:SDR family NAD(P)-dependent oxidoreductase [Allofrancisella guangzhouensis]|uniref:Oxidoreductase n=1 Tax=Allofrancisella guangzhouensis TaxID=594679 RepID=A0A0A8E546_9GAMM|nr:SDR family NAD(P)-dependent oxidoreductase [Allofrancisella guangzhouensis]AJC49365.1 oxidoreductase [Allofrancisella guangzhouensis]MBK2026994.1 SDR family NAD(P)-dependent oxidoreductase [Allofrancisella guangzhouensis]MBK2043902.1 SDR family NAD(P)-dependent oxidoreductase [Allofrancisella guangzhouensis]MBK2044985.1 SDR family NAD(P)-dependent oxidoreductase [Allofrancisella guangzhouensis]
MQKFENKTIWIIGATDGIGRAILEKLDSLVNANFIISSRSQQKLEALAKNLKNESILLAFNVNDYLEFERQATKAIAYKPDFIIYLPAFYEPSLITDISLSNINETIQTNLTAVFYLIRFTLPYIKKNPHCQLAITASVAGYIGLPKSQPYAATKAGVINLVESLKAENQELDIRLINPSFVKTKLTNKNNFKMPTLLTPEHAAKAILKGLSSSNFEIHFTKKFTLVLKLIAKLPYKLYFKVAKKLI